MERVIHLRGATITLYEDRVVVYDGAQKNRQLIIFSACCWILFGLMSLLRYFDGNVAEYHLWVGVLLPSLWFVRLGKELYVSTRSEIQLAEIRKTEFRSSFLSGETLNLKLNNGRHREINNITPVSNELQKYFAERGL